MHDEHIACGSPDERAAQRAVDQVRRQSLAPADHDDIGTDRCSRGEDLRRAVAGSADEVGLDSTTREHRLGFVQRSCRARSFSLTVSSRELTDWTLTTLMTVTVPP